MSMAGDLPYLEGKCAAAFRRTYGDQHLFGCGWANGPIRLDDRDAILAEIAAHECATAGSDLDGEVLDGVSPHREDPVAVPLGEGHREAYLGRALRDRTFVRPVTHAGHAGRRTTSE